MKDVEIVEKEFACEYERTKVEKGFPRQANRLGIRLWRWLTAR